MNAARSANRLVTLSERSRSPAVRTGEPAPSGGVRGGFKSSRTAGEYRAVEVVMTGVLERRPRKSTRPDRIKIVTSRGRVRAALSPAR